MPAVVRLFATVLASVALAGCGFPGAPTPRPAPTAPPGPGAPVPTVSATPAGFAAWAQDHAGPIDIPARALQAYAYAAASTAIDDPDCGLGWTTLAGIGSVESAHGSFGGAHVTAQGKVLPPVRGVPLDGGIGVAEIRDTDGGRVDGDAQLDRAVGPMQFIPGTWARWGTDADGDGVDDPDDIDDAALAAAHYLCARGGELGTAAGWNRAILAYNRSDTYVLEVLRRAGEYAAGRAA